MKLVLSVFWEGTNGCLSFFSSQIGVFASMCEAHDITAVPPEALEHTLPSDGQLKIAFDGCGTTYGCTGTIFASGLRGETESVRLKVLALIAHGHQIQLNVVGLSRGGCAAIFLAQELSTVEKGLSTALFLFDPVPGNLICTRIDWLCCCNTASQCLDLSGCTNNLMHLVIMVPYLPLPDLAFHAPVLPVPPQQCSCDEYVTLGCHQGALQWPPRRLACRLSFMKISEFLTQHGTLLSSSPDTDRCSAARCVAQF